MGLNIRDLRITSTDFEPEGELADAYAKDGGDRAPTLRIEGVPDGTRELALICHDPDAPLPHGFTHWTVFGIPADTTEIGPDADQRYRTGRNGFGDAGYGGPQPPPGHGVHHYYFWVYALSTEVEGTPSREEFLERYGDDIIEQNRVVGTYET
jgi:Raf kinase inhibitor-like YbhB/YbcL family protein